MSNLQKVNPSKIHIGNTLFMTHINRHHIIKYDIDLNQIYNIYIIIDIIKYLY